MLNNQMGILYCFVTHEASPFEHHQPFGSNIVDLKKGSKKKLPKNDLLQYLGKVLIV
jgi:hypothetical protein